MSSDLPTTATSSGKSVRWLSWLLGAAFLGGVVVVANHFSEERSFVRLAQEAEPVWLLAALVLQAGTYLA
jgi:Mg2+-importing ATPase